jgi:hypothetical protein
MDTPSEESWPIGERGTKYSTPGATTPRIAKMLACLSEMCHKTVLASKEGS